MNQYLLEAWIKSRKAIAYCVAKSLPAEVDSYDFLFSLSDILCNSSLINPAHRCVTHNCLFKLCCVLVGIIKVNTVLEINTGPPL